jgi:hypothetical protein
MLIVHSIPLADMRPFLADSHRLPSPSWPSPQHDHFVRGFSAVRLRRRGGFTSWIGERHYCDARILRLAALPSRPCFRRLFVDGAAMARLDFGNRHPGSLGDTARFVRLLDQELRRPLTVADAEVPLGMAEKVVAAAYRKATTKTSEWSDAEAWSVSGGAPVTLVEARPHDFHLPRHARVLKGLDNGRISVAHMRIEVAKRRHGVWLLIADAEASRDVLRRMRVALVRTHAEREVLKSVLRAIASGRIGVQRSNPGLLRDPSDALQSYLQETVTRLSAARREGLDQDWTRLANDFEDLVNEGEREALLVQLDPIRRNIKRLVESFVTPAPAAQGNVYIHAGQLIIEQNGRKTVNNQNITIGNNNVISNLSQVAGGTIQDSLNRVSNAPADEELKNGLIALHKAVIDATSKMSAAEQETHAKEVSTVATEVLNAPVDRKWHDVTAKGLLEAAASLAAIAPSVKVCVDAVLKMVGLV